MDLSNINKKLFKNVIIIIGVFVAILLIFGIIKLIIGNKLSYAKIEDKMKKAAIEYLKDEDVNISLPEGEEILTIDVEDLVANKNMKELSKYVKNDSITCDGNVVVRKQDESYLYIPYLDCGDAYKTLTLKDYILEKDGTVEEGDGIYLVNNEYVYRGEYVNNYLKFAGQTWRILKIDSEGNIKLLQTETKVRNSWDNRYNIDSRKNIGINNFELSRVNQKLEEVYNTSFSDNDKQFIKSKSLCIGSRYLGDTSKDGSTECQSLLENQKIGLIQINEFLLASIDKNCTKVRDGACQNYNYLAAYTDAWWTITANAENTYSAYEITGGTTNVVNANVGKYIRATIYLNEDVIYNSGDGTIENPYTFK